MRSTTLTQIVHAIKSIHCVFTPTTNNRDILQEVLPAWILHTRHLAELERKVSVQYAKISESKYRSQDVSSCTDIGSILG